METPELIQGEKSFHRNEGGCRHLLVPFHFHDVTSLHPLHFIECFSHLFHSFFFFFGAKPHQKCASKINFTPPHGTHVHANGVVQCLLTWRPTIYRRDVRLE